MSENKKDALNDWKYCNPEKRISQLPMPYRIIDEILNEEILQKAYKRVFEILKYDKDPNYDGNLHDTSYQGIYNIDGISCIASDNNINNNQVIIGDKWGNVHLLDLSQREVLLKKKVAQSRILHINCVVNSIQDIYLTTFSVIARGDPVIQIFRHSQFDLDIFLHYQFKCARNIQKFQNTDSINELPYISKLSNEHKFLAIGLYSGEVEIIQLPSLFEEYQEYTKFQSSILQDFKMKDISNIYYKLKIDKLKKEKGFRQIFDEFLNNQSQIKQVQQETQIQQGKQAKPDPKKQEIKKEVVIQEVESDILQLNVEQFFGDLIQDDSEGDITPDYLKPKHRIEFYFIQQEIAQPNINKTFNTVNCLDITVGLIAVIHQTNQFQFHDLQEFDIRNAPLYLLDNSDQKEDSQKGLKSNYQIPIKCALPEFTPQLRKSFKTIYPIQISQMNQSGSFLALGLKDGSTLVWDTIYECENGYPDKFQYQVTQLSFVNDNVLILGSSDNFVQGYDTKSQNVIFKRTNQFRQIQQYGITGLMGGKSGIAFALDESNTMRLYDAIHGSKILKVMPCDDDKNLSFFRKLDPIFNIQSTQLLIIAEYQNDQANIWEKQTCLLQYNIHNKLISCYPGLANLNRKGINKEQLFNAFNKMDINQLQNPSFEFKNFMQENQNKDMQLQEKQSSIQKLQSDTELNQTFQSQNIIHNKCQKKQQTSSRLTQQALHPEKFLLSNINYQEQQPLNPSKETFNQSRERNYNKMQRQQRVNNCLAQIGKDLEIQEEKIMLENKKKNLMSIKK